MLVGLKSMRSASALVLLSPTLSSVRRAKLSKEKRSVLFIAGAEDRIVPIHRLQEEIHAARVTQQLQIVVGADHIYSDKELEVAVKIADYLVGVL